MSIILESRENECTKEDALYMKSIIEQRLKDGFLSVHEAKQIVGGVCRPSDYDVGWVNKCNIEVTSDIFRGGKGLKYMLQMSEPEWLPGQPKTLKTFAWKHKPDGVIFNNAAGIEKKLCPDLYESEGKSDHGKPRLALVPPSLIEAVGKVLTFGAEKYTPNGWKKVVRESPDRYKDAMMRHLCAYLENEYSVDRESGYPHLWHLACCVAFLIDNEKKTPDKEENQIHEDSNNN